MTYEAEALHKIRVEIYKAYSALWIPRLSDTGPTAYQFIGAAIDLLNFYDSALLPEVCKNLIQAQDALRSGKGGEPALDRITFALLLIQDFQSNKKTARDGAA